MKTDLTPLDASKISSLGAGGMFKNVCIVKEKGDIRRFYEKYGGEKILIAGGLTNTLVLSGGTDEKVLFCGLFKGTEVKSEYIKCLAGERLCAVASEAEKNGLSGAENISGIPGTVGGAVFGNAGSFGSEISDLVVNAEVFRTDDGKTEILDRRELGFSYRKSILRPDKDFVCEVTLNFKREQREEIRKKVISVSAKRAATQPKKPSLGSVFKRAGDVSAGFYIEKAGLKGFGYGGMAFSDLHANFIVNKGGGTPEEYLYLMTLAEKKVFETFGIRLVREVKVLGESGNS